jgi:chromate reductase, NAD(P)H dehydrogenase (quinone)
VIPLYDGDLESRHGLPDGVRALKSLLREHDGLLFAAPEYNGSISGVLKNAIDWTSRPEGDEPRCACYKGKVAAVMSASPGPLCGAKGLIHTRVVLSNIGCIVLPDQVTVANAANAFDRDGALRDERLQRAVETIAHRLVGICRKVLS